jgi:hypothetical protein
MYGLYARDKLTIHAKSKVPLRTLVTSKVATLARTQVETFRSLGAISVALVRYVLLRVNWTSFGGQSSIREKQEHVTDDSPRPREIVV